MKINELFKHRSVTSCMSEAYNLITSNLKDLVKHTWMATLPYAFLTALFIYLRTPNKALHDWGDTNPIISFLFQSIVYWGLIVAAFFAGAILWHWITNKPFGQSLKRFTLASVCSIAFIMISGLTIGIAIIALCTALGISFSPVSRGCDFSAPIFFALIIIISILFFLLPFAYIIPRYMLLDKEEPMKVWKSFKTGLRHSGSIFKMGFLGALLIMVCSLILNIPLSILTGAQIYSQIGALEGDPIGVPGYFSPLYIIISTVAFFVYNYVNYWLLTSFVYLYGSIESDEREKQNNTLSINIK